MVSYKDIREETGLALSTISKYFNGQPVRELNRIAIERAASRLDFQPNRIARSLRLQQTRTVGVLLPALDSEFHLSIIAGTETALKADGLSVIVASSHAADDGAVNLLMQQMVDGIIAVPSPHDAEPLQAALRKIPVVLVDRRLPDLPADGVFLANQDAGAMAVRHLVDHGHSRIALLGGPNSISTMEERIDGACRELRALDLDVDGRLVERVPLTVDEGRRATLRLLACRPRPSAIFATNVDLTLGCIIAINDSGLRLGRDVSLIGFDGQQFARATVPSLAVIAQPTHAIAATAAELMRGRLHAGQSSPEPTTRLLPPDLIAGGSVARIEA